MLSVIDVATAGLFRYDDMWHSSATKCGVGVDEVRDLNGEGGHDT